MAELGNNQKCYIGASLSGTWTVIGGETNNTVNLNGNPVEVSDKTSPWQKYIAGLRGGTIDVTAWADNSDAQQKALLTALKGGSSVFVFVGKLSTSGSTTTLSEGVACEAIVSSISTTNDNGSASSRSISLQLTGEPTIYPTS